VSPSDLVRITRTIRAAGPALEEEKVLLPFFALIGASVSITFHKQDNVPFRQDHLQYLEGLVHWAIDTTTPTLRAKRLMPELPHLSANLAAR
jgi:hypothetical protein